MKSPDKIVKLGILTNHLRVNNAGCCRVKSGWLEHKRENYEIGNHDSGTGIDGLLRWRLRQDRGAEAAGRNGDAHQPVKNT
jgi:hypothetical protein